MEGRIRDRRKEVILGKELVIRYVNLCNSILYMYLGSIPLTSTNIKAVRNDGLFYFAAITDDRNGSYRLENAGIIGREAQLGSIEEKLIGEKISIPESSQSIETGRDPRYREG